MQLLRLILLGSVLDGGFLHTCNKDSIIVEDSVDDKDFTDDEDIIDDEVSITDDEEAPAVVNEAIRKAGPDIFKLQLPSILTL